MIFSRFILPLSLFAMVSIISCGSDSSSDSASASPSASSENSASASAESTATPSASSIMASAAAGNGCNTITWSSLTGAASYNLYWSTSADLSTANGTLIPNITSPYTQSNVTNGTKIYYLITAISSGTEIGFSSILNATPVGVSGITAISGNNSLILSWGTVSDASSYNLYYSTSSGITTSNSSSIISVSSPYTLTGLANGTTYYIIVTAVISSVESAGSAVISKATANNPSAPTGVTVTATDTTIPVYGQVYPVTGYVDIAWTAVSGATSYNIYWSSDAAVSTSAYDKKATVTTTTYRDNSVYFAPEYYIVTAVIGSSESTASETIEVQSAIL